MFKKEKSCGGHVHYCLSISTFLFFAALLSPTLSATGFADKLLRFAKIFLIFLNECVSLGEGAGNIGEIRRKCACRLILTMLSA